MYAQCDSEGNKYVIFDSIVDYVYIVEALQHSPNRKFVFLADETFADEKKTLRR